MRRATEEGLTLLEVVIALMLFAMISVFLLSGHSQAADATLRAEIDRNMAELLGIRLNLIALQPDEYEDGDSGEFPQSGASERLVDEAEIFGDRYRGYRWEVEMQEMIGTGASGPVSVADSEPKNLLFAEEGVVSEDSEDEEVSVEASEVDQMLFIRVTVYPPGYEEVTDPEEVERALQPRSAWTAIYQPTEEVEGEPR